MDVIQTGIQDVAYAGGTLMLAEVTEKLAGTFCHECFVGIISAGSGSNSKERSRIYEKLSGCSSPGGCNHAQGGKLPTSTWNTGGCTVKDSPLVTRCHDGQKQTAVPGIQKWYKDHNNVDVPDSNVYMFDDRTSNIAPFKYTAYNARQISCDSRDKTHGGAIGLCGARLSEIQRVPGVSFCSGAGSSDDANLLEIEDGKYSDNQLII